jgi:prepilin-type N-terminal cleavage/methylation domain-containing protein
MRRERGFTIIEVLFALFVGVILMGAAYVAMTSGQQTSAGVERKVAAQQDVRGALQVMGLELSMASYNPNYISGIWQGLPAVGGNCAASGDQVYRGIQLATPTSILVEMDVGESNVVGDDQGEMVLYDYDLANQFISRETINCPGPRGAGGAMPFLGASVQSRTVRVINDQAPRIENGHNELAIFRYWDAQNPPRELYPGTSPGTDIPRIRRVDIALRVETDEVDPSTKARRQMIYSTSVAVRNHAIIH